MTIQKNYSVNFGIHKTGLSSVGYTLSGSPRSTFSVSESVPGSGIYSAQIAHDIAFVGSIVWDTGEATPHFAVEDINPGYLSANGLDAILVEPQTSGGQAIKIKDSLAIISAVLAGATTQDETTNTITFYAVGNPSTVRLTAITANQNRKIVTPSLASII